MSKGQVAREIDEEAALWAVKTDGRDPAAGPDPALHAWLDGDPRRAGAYLRAQAALSLIDRARALPPSELEPNISVQTIPRRALLAWGGASAVAAGGGAIVMMNLGETRQSTGLGEIRRAPLADGTQVVLNTNTDLKIRLTSRQRQVELLNGEAWFDVAQETERPFRVQAGDAQFQALGTAFSVKRLGGRTDLQVTEGTVEAWVAASNERALVNAGHRLTISGEAGPLVVVPDHAAIRRGLAWRQGEVVLDGETLAEAASEFNRYNTLKIVVEDPELRQERLVGLFRTGDPESFVASVTSLTGAESYRVGEELRLRRR